MTTVDREEPNTVLNREEMEDILRARVREIYDFSLPEYRAAVASGTLPFKPEGAWLGAFTGEGDCAQPERR